MIPTEPVFLPAISIWQPHAQLIIWKAKRFETRSWTPHKHVLKPGDLIVIHASKRFTVEEKELCQKPYFREQMLAHGVDPNKPVLPLGALLGIARYLGSKRSEQLQSEISIQERVFGGYGPRRFGWELEMLHVFPVPIPARGEQGIFRVALPVESINEVPDPEPPPAKTRKPKPQPPSDQAAMFENAATGAHGSGLVTFDPTLDPSSVYARGAWATMYDKRPITARRRDFRQQMQPLRDLCRAAGLPYPHDYSWQAIKHCGRTLDNPFLSTLWG